MLTPSLNHIWVSICADISSFLMATILLCFYKLFLYNHLSPLDNFVVITQFVQVFYGTLCYYDIPAAKLLLRSARTR